MSDVETRFHETWLGMVQPIDGLVVSVPVLVDAQCMQKQRAETQQKLLELCPTAAGDQDARRIENLDRFLEALLDLRPADFDRGDALPEDLHLYVPEGQQDIRPTLALKKQPAPDREASETSDTPAALAGRPYVALVWEVPEGLDLDKPEAKTGTWEYPPSAKFDRLLRHCRVPIGLLTNKRAVRLVYAPHGESSGSITFRIDDMATVGGRPILDALVMLVSATRFFGVAADKQLPAILEESRKRQANVTNALAEQVFEALEHLLRGFEAAAERDGDSLLREAMERDDDHVYGGLLTVLLRLVFVLYAEDRGLLPVDNDNYAAHMSLLGLFERLRDDNGAFPDSMSRRFGAWSQVVTLFRAIFLGARHEGFEIPARRGDLFDPERFPFLEGWGPSGAAPITQDTERASVRVPTVDDGTVFVVLSKLLMLQGQRLSYRTLDVEQIGSVYEALMGYHVIRMTAPAVCIRPNRVWVTADEVLGVAPAQRAKWLKETLGLAKAQAEKLAAAVKTAKDEAAVLDQLDEYRVKGTVRARPLHSPDRVTALTVTAVLDEHVVAAITLRLDSGLAEPDRFEVLFAADRTAPAVHFDHDLLVEMLVSTPPGKVLGDTIWWSDVGRVQRLRARRGDTDCYAVVVGLRRPDGSWIVLIDGRYDRAAAEATLARSREYLATAESAVAAGHIYACSSNLYDAFELCACANLHVVGRVEREFAMARDSHAAVCKTFSRYAHENGVSNEEHATLKRLHELRLTAKYGGREVIEPTFLQGALDLCRQAQDRVQQILDRPLNAGAGLAA